MLGHLGHAPVPYPPDYQHRCLFAPRSTCVELHTVWVVRDGMTLRALTLSD